MEKKNEALKYLAMVAYKIGYGTQRHFTTYDITMKIPLIISLLTISVGCVALINKNIGSNYINISLIIMGVISLYITNSEYYFNSENYIKTAKKLNEKYIQLGRIHYELTTNESCKIDELVDKIRNIEDEFHDLSLPNQIVFSGFIAKYLFRRKGSIKWIKDIIPERFRNNYLKVFSVLIVLSVLSVLSVCIISYIN